VKEQIISLYLLSVLLCKKAHHPQLKQKSSLNMHASVSFPGVVLRIVSKHGRQLAGMSLRDIARGS